MLQTAIPASPAYRNDVARQIRQAKAGRFNYFTRRGIWLTSLGHRLDVNRQIGEMIGLSFRPVRILDVGCAHGFLAKQIKTSFGTAVEVHALDVKEWKDWSEPKGVNFKVGYAEKLSSLYPEGYFDFVLSTYAICYTPHQLDALKQIAKITADEGLIAVHLNGKRLERDIGELAEELRARVTRFPPIRYHPIYSFQFKKGLIEGILLE